MAATPSKRRALAVLTAIRGCDSALGTPATSRKPDGSLRSRSTSPAFSSPASDDRAEQVDRRLARRAVRVSAPCPSARGARGGEVWSLAGRTRAGPGLACSYVQQRTC